ncbi:hypothetical protein ID854_15205 [Xenorhabdus sp. M]|uniref:Uncharacterized protein n=1 Tax=Xenorhabdus szentirmaii TaxID=290112 RepID=A0AAW3YY46_9GAMM|nr:hypothetical protein [Xenorhabdus sp. M]MBD2801756.1 hypothetical protein [Xenorhabdus sp. M]
MFYELGFGDNFYKYFSVEEGDVYFLYSDEEKIKLSDMLSMIHDWANQCIKKGDGNTLLAVHDFHRSVISFLTDYNDGYYLPFDDYYVNNTYPDFFLERYKNNKEEVFHVIKECTYSHLERMNAFVSKMIVMNYIYYVLKDDPKEILIFKKFLGKNNDIFLTAFSFILDVRFYIKKSHFKGLYLGCYLSKIPD